MNSRCNTESSGNYARYGAAGVTVCERWQKFENFLSDMGVRPEGTSLDRYPNSSGNYEPGNCRWATAKEQSANRRNTLFLEYMGKRLPLTQWARELDISESLLRKRKLRGWDDARVINEPINTQFIRK